MEDTDKKLEELAKKHPSILKTEPVKKIELHPEDLKLIIKFGKYVLSDAGVELVFNEHGGRTDKFKIESVRPNGTIYTSKKWVGSRLQLFC